MALLSYAAALKKGLRPLHGHEVPAPKDLTTELLMQLYMQEVAVGLSSDDALWYFRPWRTDKPTEPGVYARFMFRDLSNGFAYFTGGSWLMPESQPNHAAAVGKKYQKAVAEQNWQSAQFYISNNQNVCWSDAPVASFEGLRTPTWAENDGTYNNRVGTLRHDLALLRYALDPLRRTAGLGELLA